MNNEKNDTNNGCLKKHIKTHNPINLFGVELDNDTEDDYDITTSMCGNQACGCLIIGSFIALFGMIFLIVYIVFKVI